MKNEEPQINYYAEGNGWVGYTIWWRGKIMPTGGICRSRALAVKDAKANVRRLLAQTAQQKNVTSEETT